MRIAAISDIHLNFKEHQDGIEGLLDQINNTSAEVLVIAGDISAGNLTKAYSPWLDRISYQGAKIAIPGNHDVWQAGASTWNRYREVCSYLSEKGWYVLDNAPVKINGVSFVGNLGWYDYSFFPKADAKRDEQARGMSVILRENITGWNDLRRYLPTKELPRICTWNDAHFVEWGKSDEKMAQFFSDKLRGDIETVSKKSDTIVCVTHHLPFEELVTRTYLPAYDFCNAFTGSSKLGEALRESDKVKVAVCGHTHSPQQKRVGHIDALEVSFNPLEPSLVYIDV